MITCLYELYIHDTLGIYVLIIMTVTAEKQLNHQSSFPRTFTYGTLFLSS